MLENAQHYWNYLLDESQEKKNKDGENVSNFQVFKHKMLLKGSNLDKIKFIFLCGTIDKPSSTRVIRNQQIKNRNN